MLYTTKLICFPKNLIPWQDSNPGNLVPEADMMSSAPRRQGEHTLKKNLAQTFIYCFIFNDIHNHCILSEIHNIIALIFLPQYTGEGFESG
jgi:hypothetical protein